MIQDCCKLQKNVFHVGVEKLNSSFYKVKLSSVVFNQTRLGPLFGSASDNAIAKQQLKEFSEWNYINFLLNFINKRPGLIKK